MKTCFKCLCAKPLEEFYKHAAMGDGHLNKCKECAKADVAANRIANLERIRAYDRMRASTPHRVAARKEYGQTENGKLARRKASLAQRQRNAKRVSARNSVANAIRDGRLAKQPCWVCGAKAVAHHPDYGRPLDVVWLCQPHHKQAHALVANESRKQKAA